MVKFIISLLSFAWGLTIHTKNEDLIPVKQILESSEEFD